ncbi:hypothetical protein L6452_40247 [Arctium lappa]|uniref:Uncharacterized protein n=1 Tax=Arctium lappa TaxID=4217 RepID=A0ACB8XLR7_ARCLA|nr:hypothetical protein L6452_40247 [Arctium lappa]
MYLAVVPMFHIYGLTLFVMILSLGTTFVFMREFNLNEMMDFIDRYGVTHLPGVPPLVTTLTKMGTGGRMKSLKHVLCNYSIEHENHRGVFAVFPQVDFIQTKPPWLHGNWASYAMLISTGELEECIVMKMIRFNTRVEYVGIQDYSGLGKDLRWIVKRKLKDSDRKVVAEVFDVVVVATGHYSHPRLPSIKGMDDGEESKCIAIYTGFRAILRPVVVGNSLSGHDISMELVNVDKEIHLSAKLPGVLEGLSKVISKRD